MTRANLLYTKDFGLSTFFTYFIRLLIFSHFKNKKRANVTVTCPILYGFILVFGFCRLRHAVPWVIYRSFMPACLQRRRVSSSQMEDCTSPMWAHPIISMQRRDCPIPPPMVSGNSPRKRAEWKGRDALSVQPLSVNCRIMDSSSTRIPMEEISSAFPSTSSQNIMSPFNAQSS